MKKTDSKISFTKNLLQWSKKNERSFPWKETNDPYKIWLSEIILQQTRVEQGLPYYLKMVKLFPTVQHLAKAKEDAILKAWQGLGYYSRARNLQSAAKYIMDERHGKIPTDYDGWLKVKGVGPYAAAAIVSFAYNLPHAVVDGNVYRVLSRSFGIDTPIDSTEGKKIFSTLANELIAQKEAGRFNQAIMDLGATVCKPASPQCNTCPVQENCVARKKNLISILPVKGKKLLLKDRYFHFIIAQNEKGFLVEKRNGNDIWKGLYQFPLIEAEKFLSPKKIQEHPLLT
ncbi:MAG: A/G-specific adenine glycosylase [Bacteroidota bacterium]